MSFSERQYFLEAYLLQEKKRFQSGSSKRQFTITYYLPTKENKSKELVCKTMFLHTLGRKTDGLVTNFFNRKHANTGHVVTTDLRAKTVNKIRTEKMEALYEKIKNHIFTFNPQVSHYKLEHAPHRKYLPSDITTNSMWLDFKEKNGSVASYSTYFRVFKKQNIGFDRPSQDDCPLCEEKKHHEKEIIGNITHSRDDCESCILYQEHKLKYIRARKAYKADKEHIWPQNVNIFTVDMQKVLIIPKMKTKNSYFVSRLVVFNETFAPLHQHDTANICVLWHEAITGRTAADVASTFFNILQNSKREVMTFIFWADNCCAQNKNWILFSSLIILMQQSWSPETVTFKYFEPGHSYMRADSVHGNIGRKLKKTEEVLDMNDLEELIKKSDNKNECRRLSEHDFYYFSNNCQKRSKKNQLPMLDKIKVVQFRLGSTSIYYKNSHESDIFEEFENLCNVKDLPEKRTEAFGMNSEKKNKICKVLLPLMSARKRAFWESLKSNDNARDLCSFRE